MYVMIIKEETEFEREGGDTGGVERETKNGGNDEIWYGEKILKI